MEAILLKNYIFYAFLTKDKQSNHFREEDIVLYIYYNHQRQFLLIISEFSSAPNSELQLILANI